jgi:hypothetical protein
VTENFILPFFSDQNLNTDPVRVPGTDPLRQQVLVEAVGVLVDAVIVGDAKK